MSLKCQSDFVRFTDNLSVPQTMDYSVNPGFTKLVSSTDNSSTNRCFDQIAIFHSDIAGNLYFTERDLGLIMLARLLKRNWLDKFDRTIVFNRINIFR